MMMASESCSVQRPSLTDPLRVNRARRSVQSSRETGVVYQMIHTRDVSLMSGNHDLVRLNINHTFRTTGESVDPAGCPASRGVDWVKARSVAWHPFPSF